MKMKQCITVLCLVLLFLIAGGCGGKVKLSVASQPNVNPDHSGRPSPIIVKMYELRSNLAFNQNDFMTLFETPVQALGNDLITADELVFVPGEAHTIYYKPDPETKFVGILAGFRQMERATWRTIKAIDPESKNYVNIELTDTTMLLIDGKNADDWDPEEAVRTYQGRFTPPPGAEQTQPGAVQPTAEPAPAPQPAAGGQNGYSLPPSRRI